MYTHKKTVRIFIDAVKSTDEIFSTTGTFRVSPNEGDKCCLAKSQSRRLFVNLVQDEHYCTEFTPRQQRFCI